MMSVINKLTESISNMSLPSTYKVAESTNKSLKIATRDLPKPKAGEVLIKVLASGICHSDSITVHQMMGSPDKLVPGHEIVGTIVAAGDQIKRFKIGDVVGRGWFGGCCIGTAHKTFCKDCRKGQFATCETNIATGVTQDGGHAEYCVASWESLAIVPSQLKPHEACSLMCAGVTTFNSIRNQKISPGSLVGVQGIGGLGHLAIQFCNKMGFRIVAISTNDSKKELATKLGAHHYIDGSKQDAVKELQKLGGAALIVCTAFDTESQSKLIDGLASEGKLLTLGVDHHNYAISPLQLIPKKRSVVGWASGTAEDSEQCLEFCAQTGIRPLIEIYSLDAAQEAYDRMMSGKARFRVVLVPGYKGQKGADKM
jgi:alcohol dehydrogenase/propanol-preferring alcohol dehydrogenase